MSIIRVFAASCALASLLFIHPANAAGNDDTAIDNTTNSDTTNESAIRTLQVVSYNIRLATKADGEDYWPHRSDAVSEFIAKWDVIGLQEVTPEQFDDLREQLGGDFDSYGLGREDGVSKGEHAAVFYRRDRVKALDTSTFWLCETPDKPGVLGWDAVCARTVSWLRLQDISSGTEFVFANTHFDHRGSTARLESANMVSKRVGQLPENTPFILLGDFNCRPDSEPYKALVAAGLADARSAAVVKLPGPNSTWNGFKAIAPGQTIDHAFVSGPVTVTEFQIHDPKTAAGRFASDHLPIRLAIRWDHLGKP
ncbi:endonuclease/exonuclease/phosphatase family protein [Stieleria varia]|uniref:Endonuclease/Exonuclease/phosphatase family protein n=1 Tax=Stieleria varia TaxID=2528005 RepID=A0A5C6ATS8_9BACT|nr:endonuclease/exonuclease/phosphatase family protein [Stieleria varia]TWU02821.1 Endonuclease/Exonuclease/phosphatase family protein [Stieleria varia]